MQKAHHEFVNRYLYDNKLKNTYKQYWDRNSFIYAKNFTNGREYYNADHNGVNGNKYRTGTDFLDNSCPKTGWVGSRFGGTNGCSSHAKLKHCSAEYQHNKDEANARDYKTNGIAQPYQVAKALHYVEDLFTPVHNMSVTASGYVFNQGLTPNSTNSDILGLNRPIYSYSKTKGPIYNNSATSNTNVPMTDTWFHGITENKKFKLNSSTKEGEEISDLFEIKYEDIYNKISSANNYVKNTIFNGSIPTGSLYTNNNVRNYMKNAVITMKNAFESNNMNSLETYIINYVAIAVVLTYNFVKSSALGKYFN